MTGSVINVGITGSTITSIKPVVSIQVVNLATQVSSLVAASSVSYILMYVDAFLDVRGLYPVYLEQQHASDHTSLGFLKNKFESLGAVDQLESIWFGKGLLESKHAVDVRSLSISKPLSDGVHSQDDFNTSVPTDDGEVMLFSKQLPTEYLFKSDVEHMSFGKRATESQHLVDINTFFLGKNRADLSITSDNKVFSLSKALADSLHAGDEMNAIAITDDGEIMIFGKTLSDSFVNSDVTYVQAEKNINDTPIIGDTLLPFQLGKGIEESQTIRDVYASSYEKPLSDGVINLDAIGISNSKSFAERQGAQDGPNAESTYWMSDYATDNYVLEFFPELLVTKNRTEVISTADIHHTSSIKAISDGPIHSDRLSYFTGKLLSDTASSSDADFLYLTKHLSDSSLKSDQALIVTFKSANDSSMMSDSHTQDIGKGLLDSALTSEAHPFSFSKLLSDSVHPTDAYAHIAVLDDDENMLFGKISADGVLKSDFNSILSGKNLTDVVSKSDSGSLRMTSYCDVNYFTSDYVGSSLSF